VRGFTCEFIRTIAWYAAAVGRYGRTVIVTGGTGALGRLVVERFLAGRDLVVVPWVAKPERDEVAQLWDEHISSGRITLIEADISTTNGALRVAQAAPEVDVLINSAGGFAGGAPIYEAPVAQWDDMWALNLRTALQMTHAVLPGMLRRSQGSIACIAARAAYERPPCLAAYTASKAALIVFVETLQKELASTQLRINAVAPATIDTPANRRAMPHADPSDWSDPTEIAETLYWLTGPNAHTVRGAIIPV